MSLALLASLIVVVVALVFWLRGQDRQEQAAVVLAAGDVAPNFSLPDVDDQTVSLTDFEDRNVLLYFSMGSG